MQNTFGEQFRRMREERGISRVELARRMGHKSASYLYDIETGVFIPTDDNLRELARALGVPLTDLRGMALETKVQELGIRDPGFVSMLKNYPRLSRQDKQAIIDAYRQIKCDKGWTR
ncbi:MAG: helix-turn-helix transcriptional regulator [Dehalococcoidia bacterium]|nr:helix-turn-helix transcriptional regulator [Dehalococcoidia bacterium]